MSRGRTRARNRRARLLELHAEFEKQRENPEAFAALLRRLAALDLSIWSVARQVPGDKPLEDAELAMIAQIVAPQLAGMTPGLVHRRHKLAK
jgi:hypothetical protein